MGECEVTSEAPAWMVALERKRQRIHKLAHEVGAGSPCLLCGEACPGLDLHFWRKICRNCKCKKEDHDVIDDCSYEQFEILLGTGHSKNHSKKAFLELLEKQTSSATVGKAKRVAFDWVPPNVSPDVAAEYMQSLPSSKLPISGSDGALYRRQQLERQLPLHDLDANHCHQLTDFEADNLKKYLENIQNNVVGQGRISKYGIPVSKSVETLHSLRTFNSVPKPFRAGSAQTPSCQLNNLQPLSCAEASGLAQNLRPPSSFLPSPSSVPQPLSSRKNVDLPSVADRGALFGVNLAPPFKQEEDKQNQPNLTNPTNLEESSFGGQLFPSAYEKHPLNSNAQAKSFDRGVLSQSKLNSQLVKTSIPNLVAHSGHVPGNMWVPQECAECCQQGVSGRILSDKVCSHISKSDPLSHTLQMGHSFAMHPPPADKLQVLDSNAVLPLCLDDQKRTCICPDGYPCEHCHSIISTNPLIASSDACGSMLPPQSSSVLSQKDHLKSRSMLPDAESTSEELMNKLNPSFPKEIVLNSSDSISEHPLVTSEQETNVTNYSTPYVEQEQRLSPHDCSAPHSVSPSTGISPSAGSPHVLALYAHNALHSPSSLDPHDSLSPHMASLALDDAPYDSANKSEGTSLDKFNATSYQSSDLKCAHCSEIILPGEVVVFADRAGPGVVWHPKCFVCNTCQELLVDLVYFYNRGHVYCGRHFAELLDIPRCSACDELIFVKEYTVAEGQAFHVKHFCCFECDEALGGKQYVPKDGQPICLPCYEQKYGKTCKTCRNKIGAKDQGVTWKDLHWHATPKCFCCAACRKSLLGGRFAVKEQQPYCSKECMQAL